MVLRPSACGWAAIGFLGAIACHPASAQQEAPGSVTVPEGKPALVPLGDVAGGFAVGSLPVDMPNPLEGKANVAEQGKQLFIQMNCAGCHGYAAAGGVMAPALTDLYWRYGGTPVDIFKSIYEGRPKGMPAWSGMLPPESIWMIVSFIQSLGGTFPASFYQQAWDGDRPGELVAPELAAGKSPAAQQESTPARQRPKEQNMR